MPLLCAKCGYENKDNYRFCGMCGTVFPAADSAATTSRTSFSDPPTSAHTAAYLLEEDEPAPTHGRMYLALILLIISGLLLVWHWRRDGYPWNPSSANQTQASQTQAVTSPPPADGSVTQVSSSSTDSPASSAVGASAVGTSPVPTENGQEAAQQPSPSATTPADASPAEQNDSSHQQNDIANAASVPNPVEEKETKTSAPEKPAPSRPTPAAISYGGAAPISGDEKLVAEGEKYLYGNGVPQDCDRATRGLKAAAAHSNPKAFSLLGSMYASGNCVSRDLPTAYRWFAQALHAEPTNSRIERDLELIWNQLTPGERQVALHNGQ